MTRYRQQPETINTMLIIEQVINRYLALDPEVQGKLSELEGKVIRLDLVGTNKQLFVFPTGHGLQIRQNYDGDVDTVLSGSSIALFKMGILPDSANLLLKGEVELHGDTRLGHRFKRILSQMDIDWAEPLAEIVGDELAYQLVQTGRKFTNWGKSSIQSFSQSFSEYLQEESRDAVTESEIEIFNQGVDALREDVERLQARIKAIQTKTDPD